MARRAYEGPWPRIRLSILERDGYLCQIRGRHCTTRATDVDHIIPINQGGAWYDPDNLRAACSWCNTARVGHQQTRRWESAITHITVVVGDGASDYVKLHSQPSDMIIDSASLTKVLGIQGAALTRTRLIGQLRAGRISASRVWITTGDASEDLPSHRVINLGGVPTVAASRSPLRTPAAVPSRAW